MLYYLSRQDGESVASASTLAKAVNAPPEHARKILMRLCEAGLTSSITGRSGGYTRAGSLEDMSLLDVLDALDPAKADHGLAPRMCAAAPDEVCSVQLGLAEVSDRMRGLLSGISLASLVGRGCPRTTGTSEVTGFDRCRTPVEQAVTAF